MEWYLDATRKSREEFEAAKFNPNDPIFEKQKLYLNTLSYQNFSIFLQLYDKLKAIGYDTDFTHTETFLDLHENVYDLKLIFNFNWMAWHSGWKIINDINYDYSNSSLINLSMYITAIFRADRFSDGTIKENF